MDKLEAKLSGEQLKEIKSRQFNDIVTYLRNLNDKYPGLGFSQLEELVQEKQLSECTHKMIKRALTDNLKTKK